METTLIKLSKIFCKLKFQIFRLKNPSFDDPKLNMLGLDKAYLSLSLRPAWAHTITTVKPFLTELFFDISAVLPPRVKDHVLCVMAESTFQSFPLIKSTNPFICNPFWSNENWTTPVGCQPVYLTSWIQVKPENGNINEVEEVKF